MVAKSPESATTVYSEPRSAGVRVAYTNVTGCGQESWRVTHGAGGLQLVERSRHSCVVQVFGEK